LRMQLIGVDMFLLFRMWCCSIEDNVLVLLDNDSCSSFCL